MIKVDYFDAIESLCPGANFSMQTHEDGTREITWNSPDIPQPSHGEILKELERLQAEEPKQEIRELRNKKLAETDWIVIQSKELNIEIPNEWKLYRQSLRDITTQVGFPSAVEWPTLPK